MIYVVHPQPGATSTKGEIMKVGYTFACFMTKKTVFSQVIQLPTYKSIFFILNFTLQ
jgi:hypothetical protein